MEFNLSNPQNPLMRTLKYKDYQSEIPILIRKQNKQHLLKLYLSFGPYCRPHVDIT